MKKQFLITAAVLVAGFAPASKAGNLLLNGGFELTNNGYSETLTPVDWTNVGHIDGVIAYSVFNTPAYDGNYFYDLGGYGQALPNSGDGIEQTVTTSVGAQYALVFGMSNENVGGHGPDYLNVLINGSLLQTYLMVVNGSYGELGLPFTTQTLSYTATSTSSTIEFTVTGSDLGYDDPMIDGISFSPASSSVPEPATWFGCAIGLGVIAARYRRSLSRK